MDVGWWDAWSAWWGGNLDPGAELYGVSILWWGRIGRIASLVAALTIIAEIVGPVRFRRFGESLKTKRPGQFAESGLRGAFEWAASYVRAMASAFPDAVRKLARRPTSGNYKAFTETERPGMDTTNVIVALCLFAFGVYLAFRLADSWAGTLFVAFFGGWFALAAAPVVSIGLVVVAMVLLLGIDQLVLAVASVLEREALSVWIKIGSLLLLLVGFHFDLLSQ